MKLLSIENHIINQRCHNNIGFRDIISGKILSGTNTLNAKRKHLKCENFGCCVYADKVGLNKLCKLDMNVTVYVYV